MSARRAVDFVLVAALVLAPSASSAETPPGARALEARLLAPCCYGGTLDIHESELAHSLRDEIESRIARGESSDAIQSDFVARYGERVVAARSDASIRGMALAIALALLLAGGALLVAIRRWTRRAAAKRSRHDAADAPRDALDDRIDRELAELDAW